MADSIFTKVRIIKTSRDTSDRLTEKEYIPSAVKDITPQCVIKLDTNRKYQEILGFGGAITEASAYTILKMSPEKQREILDAYFDGKKGLNYKFCRTHMNSCDFALGNYSYCDTHNDTALHYFSIDRDSLYLLPVLKEAVKTAGSGFKLYSSPWSPPAWMKTNGRMNNGGSLKKEFQDTWADFYIKYIQEYKKAGIDIWGLTVQNEPMAVTPWDNCIYTEEEERDFIKILGPALDKAGLGDIKIIAFDHNKDIMKKRVDTIFSDPEAAKWVWGVGFHWYGHGDDGTSIKDNSVLDYTHDTFGTNLVFTEGCNPLHGNKPFIGEWWTGEKYGSHIINDLNHWTTAWTDWNIVLDENGGPNHVMNYCDAPIIADTTTDTVYYNSPYYYMGHFSKFILPGAVRIHFESSDDTLKISAFMNPNGEAVIVIMNDTDDERIFEISIGGFRLTGVAESHSIQTLIIGQ